MRSRSEFEGKFRSVGLDPEDRDGLLECIRQESNLTHLGSLLYMWGYSFEELPEVRALCIKHIEQPYPALTAICLKLVCNWWGHWREYEQQLSHYLDAELFEDEWYEEVIVAFSFISRNPYGWSAETLERFGRLERESVRIGLDSFY